MTTTRTLLLIAAVALVGCAAMTLVAPVASAVLAGWLTAVVYGLARLAQ